MTDYEIETSGGNSAEEVVDLVLHALAKVRRAVLLKASEVSQLGINTDYGVEISISTLAYISAEDAAHLRSVGAFEGLQIDIYVDATNAAGDATTWVVEIHREDHNWIVERRQKINAIPETELPSATLSSVDLAHRLMDLVDELLRIPPPPTWKGAGSTGGRA